MTQGTPRNPRSDMQSHSWTLRDTKRRPIDIYQEEKPHLLSLPVRVYDTAQVFYRTVNPEGL